MRGGVFIPGAASVVIQVALVGGFSVKQQRSVGVFAAGSEFQLRFGLKFENARVVPSFTLCVRGWGWGRARARVCVCVCVCVLLPVSLCV